MFHPQVSPLILILFSPVNSCALAFPFILISQLDPPPNFPSIVAMYSCAYDQAKYCIKYTLFFIAHSSLDNMLVISILTQMDEYYVLPLIFLVLYSKGSPHFTVLSSHTQYMVLLAVLHSYLLFCLTLYLNSWDLSLFSQFTFSWIVLACTSTVY